MALFTGNGPLMDVSGKAGGVIFYHRRSSNQIQPKPRKGRHRAHTPHTPRQKAFTKLWQILMLPTTQEVRSSWIAWALDHPRVNRNGYNYTLTWCQAFMSFNMYRLLNNLPHLIYPPGYEPPS